MTEKLPYMNKHERKITLFTPLQINKHAYVNKWNQSDVLF